MSKRVLGILLCLMSFNSMALKVWVGPEGSLLRSFEYNEESQLGIVKFVSTPDGDRQRVLFGRALRGTQFYLGSSQKYHLDVTVSGDRLSAFIRLMESEIAPKLRLISPTL